MDPVLPPHIISDFQGMPLWLWLQDNGQRITPATMRTIISGQRLILSRMGQLPLLVVAQHDAGQHVNVMGLHLRGRNYNDIVSPADINPGSWDLYVLPDALAPLLAAAPAAAAGPVGAPAAAGPVGAPVAAGPVAAAGAGGAPAQPQDPEAAAFEESLQMAAAAAGGAAAASNDPIDVMNNDPINPPKKSKGGKRRRHLSKKKRRSSRTTKRKGNRR